MLDCFRPRDGGILAPGIHRSEQLESSREARRRSEAVRRRTNSRFGSNGRVPRLLPERHSWRDRRLQPKTAFLRFPPVHSADLVGKQSRRKMTAICAKKRFCEGVRFGDLMQRLLGDAAACDRLFQRVVGEAVEDAYKAGGK